MGNLALIIYNIYMPIRSTIILVETRFKFANLYCHEKKITNCLYIVLSGSPLTVSRENSFTELLPLCPYFFLLDGTP